MIHPDVPASLPEVSRGFDSAPEELALQWALEPHATTEEAIAALEAAVQVCNQLSTVFQTWKEPGLARDQLAINRGSDAMIRFYEVYVPAERRESDKQAEGWGWVRGHLAANALRDMFIDRWAMHTLSRDQTADAPIGTRTWVDSYREKRGGSDEALRKLYYDMGVTDMGYFLPPSRNT